MLEFMTYLDSLGRVCRLGFEDGAWIRQEFRRGCWMTMERHPVVEPEIHLGVRTVQAPARAAGGT